MTVAHDLAGGQPAPWRRQRNICPGVFDADKAFEDLPEILPIVEDSAPGTFSQTAHLGYFPSVASLISRMMRTASKNRLERPPPSPSRFPAMDRS